MKPSVIILDFGSQFTQLIAREVRSQGVYCEIEPFSIEPSKLQAKQPKALILSGGPASFGKRRAPTLTRDIFALNVPVLGICYGMHLLSHLSSGKLESGKSREYGHAEIEILINDGLFAGFEKNQKVAVWMSHGDSVKEVPANCLVTARSTSCPIAAFQLDHFHAVQFHPEV
ncbi:MAG: glutamine-hydrolyzing GMP synthase, partial [Deltaproteobacteria bacterium]|nr:glutamine-hydrolyzing GMP synthase [Deltaproteobacteria bacterium]